MGGGDFGGNGSMEWRVFGEKVAASDQNSVPNPSGGAGGHHHDGIDKAHGADPGQLITISVKVPGALTAQQYIGVLCGGGLRPSANGKRIEFDIAIEQKVPKGNPDQIYVRWGSHKPDLPLP